MVDLTSANSVARLLQAVAASLAILAAAIWLGSAVPYVGSVDLSVFLCHARDMRNGVADSPDSAYRYFPGVYFFWRSVFAVAGESFATVQWAVVGLLAINAALITAVGIRLKLSFFTATSSAVLWLILASRYETLSGTTEPLSTVFFLAAVLLLVSKQSLRRDIVAGIFLGLCVWTKQQAGLLTLGTVWLLCESGTPLRERFQCLLVMSAAAALTLIAAVLLEGHGLAPLQQGLSMAQNYSAEGSWETNLVSVFGNDKSVVLLFIVAAGGLIAMVANETSDDQQQAAVIRIAGLCMLSFLASLIQFRTRGYYHYLLLGLPLLVIAFACGVSHIANLCSGRGRTSFVVYMVLAVLWLVPMVRSGSRELDFELFSPVLAENKAVFPWARQQPQSRELSDIAQLVKNEDSMLVLPPIRSVVYLKTGGYSPTGYVFGTEDCVERVKPGDVKFVVEVIGRDSREEANWVHTNCEKKIAELQDTGYKIVCAGSRLRLWHAE